MVLGLHPHQPLLLAGEELDLCEGLHPEGPPQRQMESTGPASALGGVLAGIPAEERKL